MLATGFLRAEAPRIGIIDFYGARKTRLEDVRKAIRVREGDPLPASKTAVEERLERLDSVVRAHLEAACCEDGKAILYVGLEERAAPHFEYREPPTQDITLPEEITETYAEFLRAVELAGRRGKTSEDLTNGHSLMADADARALQEKFLSHAARHAAELKDVLRSSNREDMRAIAAYVIGYAPRKSEVVNDLLYAMQDADETVRGNAIRSLAAFAVLARRNPSAGLKISPTWFVEMLNSVVWTDRNNAAVALVTLTETRDAAVLDQLRERALPALIEMASWKHLPHALPAYILLGRTLNLPEREIQETWSRNARESVIRRARAK